MKEKKTTTKNNTATKQIRTDSEEYTGLFIGSNDYGIYCGLRKGEDDVEFINGYEAINLVNALLNEFDTLKIEFNEAESKKGTKYEVAVPVHYTI